MFQKLLQRFWPLSQQEYQLPGDVDPTQVFRGYFDQVEMQNGELILQGWMVNWRSAYDEIRLYINGKRMGEGGELERPDVAERLPHIERSLQCGFRYRVPINNIQKDEIFEIAVRGVLDGNEAAEMKTAFVLDLFERMPIPPLELIQHVDELSSGEFYLMKGVQNFHEFWQIIERHADPTRIQSMLDWGCGSGRITGFFLHYSPIEDVHGCDIDSKAIEWANQHLKPGQFQTIGPYPPTIYKNEQFDLVAGFSVMTHLNEDNQRAWLEEIHRITKPSGLVITTVHGMTAARTILTNQQVESMKARGIFDKGHDSRLDGIAPDDYYRAIFQTPEYIYTHWEKWFHIEEIIEHGASNYHDIVVMRKRE